MSGGPAGSFEWPTTDLLTHRAQTTPERTALVDADTGETWTYRDFDALAWQLADAFEATRTRPASDPTGDDTPSRIAVLLETRVEYAASLFAGERCGLETVLLHTRETAAELRAKLERTSPELLVCGTETEALALEVAPCPILSLDAPVSDEVHGLSSVGGEDRPSGRRNPPEVDLDRSHLVVFTSGTSSEPKGVRLTPRNLLASASASALRLGVLPGDRWLSPLPMYHVGGLAPVVRSTLYGTTAVIQREFDPVETARALARTDCTGVSLVPTMLERLLETGWEPEPPLRFVLLGGAPASVDVLERALEAGVPVHPTFGMTETASQVATATPAQVAETPGTVGQPLVCTTVSILAERRDGYAPVGPGERGELVVSGPTVTPGYLDDEVTDAAFSEWGFHTGDVGYRDEHGRLWMCGRRTDRIVTGGENVDPDEVAAVLESHPQVRSAAVVGLADPEWGERVGALLVTGASEGPSTGHVLEHCRERLAGFKCPKTVGFASEVPRTHSGTVDREAVRTRLESAGEPVGDE
ncbi:class I adenylate-forming enzyme family protein [Natronobiforma cellulositropha]|uniref:class I adenylate-forming enzyme family protein n=1 Tax=Natronobiforma cellulositropha TaxID=1679076 RepID=UPI0021D5EF12|nr:class I adenylate-forming enzyme family protein [Natronobiforma cellulositropha]